MGKSNKICPRCGRKSETAVHRIAALRMRHELEAKTGILLIERTPDMVFCLQRKVIKGNVKQCPVIRFKDDL